MPPRNVVPKPVQKPHPPLWVACSRRDTIHLAAQKGIGALAFAFVDPEEAKYWVDDYYTTLEREGVPIGDAVNANVACVTTFMCHHDEDEALRRGLEGANFFGYSLAHYYVFGRHQPARTSVWDEFQAAARRARLRPRSGAWRPPRTTTGSAPRSSSRGSAACAARSARPTRSATTSQRYEECGVDQVIFCFQAGKNRHEHIMEALELFGREVLPEFAERDEKLQRDKEQRLAPVIDAVHGPQARDGSSAAAERRLRVPRDPAGDGRPRPATTTSTRCSTTSPSRRRSVPARWTA